MMPAAGNCPYESLHGKRRQELYTLLLPNPRSIEAGGDEVRFGLVLPPHFTPTVVGFVGVILLEDSTTLE
jgi:hypothetical protein